MEVPPTRKVRPVLAFLSGWLAPALGYVYAGELPLALVVVGFRSCLSEGTTQCDSAL